MAKVLKVRNADNTAWEVIASSVPDLAVYATIEYVDTEIAAIDLSGYQELIPYSSSAPSSPTQGDLWVDSSTTPPALKTYNGSAWVQLGSAVDDAQAIIASSMFTG